MKLKKIAASLAVLTIALAACGSDDDGGSTADTSAPEPSAATTPDTATPDSGTPETAAPDTGGSGETIRLWLNGGDTPDEFVGLLAEMAATARRETVRLESTLMAETDQRDLLPLITTPTLLIWGELDVRSPLSVARELEQAIPDAKLVVIPEAGHVSNLERPELFNTAVREFCLAHSPH